MSVTKTGIDIVVNLVDKTGSQFAALTRRVDGLGRIGAKGGRLQMDGMGNVSEIGGRTGPSRLSTIANTELGGRFGEGAFKTGAAVLGVQIVDDLMEGALSAIKDRKGGAQLAESLLDGVTSRLRSIPIVGPAGDFMARTAGVAFGGDWKTFEEQQVDRNAELAELLVRDRFDSMHKAQVAAFEEMERKREQDDEYHRERMETLRMMNEQERLFDATREQESLEIWRAEQEAIRQRNESDRLFDAAKEEQELDAWRAEQEQIRAQNESERRFDTAAGTAERMRAGVGMRAPTVESRFMVGRGALYDNAQRKLVEQMTKSVDLQREANRHLATMVQNQPQTVELV